MNIELNSHIVHIRSRGNRQAHRRMDSLKDVRLRTFRSTEEDYEAIVAVENANHPDSPFSANECRFYDDAREQKYLFERVVAEENGRVIGFANYGQPWWSFKEGKFFFGIQVHPQWHDENVAATLYQEVLAKLLVHQPTQLVSECREDQQYILDLLHASGYEAIMRTPQSELDVQRFDASHFNDVCDKMRSSGIRIESLAVIAAEDEHWQQKTWDLEWEILQDVPFPDQLTRMPFEQWQKRFLGSPNLTMDGQTIAREGDGFVGKSGLWTSETNPKKLYTGLTGVIRSHRRQGIATAMKIKGIRFAQAEGFEVIETDNEENNPMLGLNKQLGFEEKPAFVSYKKKLELTEPVKELLKEPL